MLYDDSMECAIIDPGCSNRDEEKQLSAFIQNNNLKPVLLLNTHCHIDHILGNYFVADTYKLDLHIHKEDLPVLNAGTLIAERYGFPYTASPQPAHFLEEGQPVIFGNTRLEVIFTPGHSAGSVCFIHPFEKSIIAGDVLFNGSIGRTDLPGGDFETLKKSIQTKLYALPEDYIVYPGHGDPTSIGKEKHTNPFVKAGLSF